MLNAFLNGFWFYNIFHEIPWYIHFVLYKRESVGVYSIHINDISYLSFLLNFCHNEFEFNDFLKFLKTSDIQQKLIEWHLVIMVFNRKGYYGNSEIQE